MFDISPVKVTLGYLVLPFGLPKIKIDLDPGLLGLIF
jgi:hypothetical protein